MLEGIILFGCYWMGMSIGLIDYSSSSILIGRSTNIILNDSCIVWPVASEGLFLLDSGSDSSVLICWWVA